MIDSGATASSTPVGSRVLIGGRPVVQFDRQPARIDCRIAMPPLARTVDVTGRPGVAVLALEDAARRERVPESQVEEATREALSMVRHATGAWEPADPAPLVVEIGGSSLPLLGAAYDRGAAPVTQVPSWVVPWLREHKPRHAARAAFKQKASKPVVRALARCLAPTSHTSQVGFAALNLAIVGMPSLEPDALARVLASDRADVPVDGLLDPATIELAQRQMGALDARTLERLLISAALRSDGIHLLDAVARFLRDLRGYRPRPVPNDIGELHAALRACFRTQPPPPQPEREHLLYRAPPGAPVEPTDRLRLMPTLVELDRREVDGLVFVVPRTAGDLTRWGHLLNNCLADFGPAAVRGATSVIGILRGDQLRYALEITVAGELRQFVAPANRPPEEWVVQLVVAELLRVGAMDARHEGNARWLAEPSRPL